ncbi:MAG: FKBP-type peptidyl-prolyl cis-trans isomerase, partial [Bacilli bacterium]
KAKLEKEEAKLVVDKQHLQEEFDKFKTKLDKDKNNLFSGNNIIILLLAALISLATSYVYNSFNNNNNSSTSNTGQVDTPSKKEYVKEKMTALKDSISTQEKYRSTTDATAIGDLVLINYEGFVDGAAFEGGTGKDVILSIGSGTFIPGFEEQLVDHKIGDEFDVKVTFPAEYQAPNLAGKEATFKVKINNIFKPDDKMKYNDDMINEMSKRYTEIKDIKTVKEFEKYFTDKYNAEYDAQYSK